jgi:hypothetical protein
MIVHEMQNHCTNYFSPHKCSTPMFCCLSIYWSRILLISEVCLRTLAKWEILRAHWSWVSYLPTHHRCNFVKAFIVGEQKPDGREKEIKSVVRGSCCVQDWQRRRIDSGLFILSLQWHFIWSRRCVRKEGNPWNKIGVQKETRTQLCVAMFSHGLLAHWHGKKKMMKRVKPWKQLYHIDPTKLSNNQNSRKHTQKSSAICRKEGERHIMYTSSRMWLIVIDGKSRRFFFF